jgi:hypothetical protein
VRKVELFLLGTPKLLIDGEEAEFSRRAVMEVLAMIVVAGEPGISRTEVAERLWPHLTKPNARLQLRGTLTRLRQELEGFQVRDAFGLESEVLRTSSSISCDLPRILSSEPRGLPDLIEAIKPFAKGWESEHWQAESDLLADWLSTAFESQAANLKKPEGLNLLRKAVKFHSTSAPLATLLVRELRTLGKADEANEVIIRFENSWIERFGNVDIPTFNGADVAHQEPETKHKPVLIALGFVVVLLGSIVAGPLFRPAQAVADSDRTRVSLVHLGSVVAGDRRLRFADSGFSREATEFREFSDGTFSILVRSTSWSQHFGIKHDGTLAELPLISHEVEDELDAVQLKLHTGKQDILSLDGVGNPVVVSPKDGFPHFQQKVLLDPKTFIYGNSCIHPFADHHQLFLVKSGIESEINPAPGQAQITVFTALTPSTMFGKFTKGRVDGWRYHAFSFDLASGALASLNRPPVIAATDKGDWICLPEVTDVNQGDYDTHWDHHVQLCPDAGHPTFLTVDGQSTFPQAIGFQGVVVVALTDHALHPGFKAFDVHGAEVRSLTSLMANAIDVSQLANGKGLLVKLNAPNRFRVIDGG